MNLYRWTDIKRGERLAYPAVARRMAAQTGGDWRAYAGAWFVAAWVGWVVEQEGE